MSYYRKKVYDSHNGDSGLNARTGQVVEVLRELTDREADIADVGRMFHVRFADGFETDVFEDELEVHDTVKIIVDGTNTFQVVDSVPLGYVIWNIGNNMADGYLPLCQVGGPDGCQVNPDTLKAVKCDGAQTILDAAHCAGTPRAMRRFLGKHQNAEPGKLNERGPFFAGEGRRFAILRFRFQVQERFPTSEPQTFYRFRASYIPRFPYSKVLDGEKTRIGKMPVC